MVRFEKNSKANFETVVKLCRRAHHFTEKKGAYSVVFARTHQDMKLAAAVLEEMSAFSWRYSLIANDRVQRRRTSFTGMLECYCVASRLKNKAAHCEREVDPAGSRISISLDEKVSETPSHSWQLPCKRLASSIHQSYPPSVAVLEAAALGSNVNLCPFFKTSQTPAIDQKVAKRYW